MPNPQLAKEYFDKGKLAVSKNNLDYAIELFSHAVSLDPTNAQARHEMRLAQGARYAQNPPFFLARFFISIKLSFIAMRASSYETQNNLKEAIAAYERILAINPTNKNALMKLGAIFLKLNDTKSALFTFEEVAQFAPDDVEVLKNLGGLYANEGDLKRARETLERGLKIAPLDQDLLRNLKDLDALGTIQRGFGAQSP